MPRDRIKPDRPKRNQRARFQGTVLGADYTEEEVAFLKAVQEAKKKWGPFLSDAQVLAVAKALGYRKVAAPDKSP